MGFGAQFAIVLPPVRAHLHDPPQAASLNQVDGVPEMSPTALLHAALQNLLAGTNCVGERRAFLQSVGDRFFQVDVFARRQCIYRHAHVPVIRGRDE